MTDKKTKPALPLLVLLASCFSAPAWAQAAQPTEHPTKTIKAPARTALDHSGTPRKGKASYYSQKFSGKTMADGTPMNPRANIAASKTLPLGTRARVTNLENGKSAIVEIRDRGPYIPGRIVDVSPKIAEQLDILEQGVAQVEVHPLEVPQPDGRVKRNASTLASNSMR